MLGTFPPWVSLLFWRQCLWVTIMGDIGGNIDPKIKGQQSAKADFDRNRDGLYGGLPKVRAVRGSSPAVKRGPNGGGHTTIKNPIEWSGAQIGRAFHAAGSFGRALHHIEETIYSPTPTVLRISITDIREALAEGFDDFAAYRSDVFFLSVTYVVVGLIMARIIFGMTLLPLLFPLASGFAIVGPFAAIGLYEMSRRREQGAYVNWANALDVFRAPAFGAIVALGMILITILLSWLSAAWAIYENTLGPQLPNSITSFIHDVFMTGSGQVMIVMGIGVGFLFALLAMTISVVAFPLLLDHDVGLDTAIKTSVRAVTTNPGPMAFWGVIIAAALIIGSIPLLFGLVIVFPILGHATWHLYRRLVKV